MKLQYSRTSLNDLQRLRAFIAEHNPSAAAKTSNELLLGIRQLIKFPHIGLPVKAESIPMEIRDLFIGNYTVRYLITEEAITVLRVWHGKEHKLTGNLNN